MGSYANSLNSYNPNKKDTNAFNVGTGAATIGNTFNTHIKLKNVQYEFQFSNQANVSGDIILYCVTPRKMLYDNQLNSNTSGPGGFSLLHMTNSTVYRWWNLYITQQYGAGATVPAAAIPLDASGVQSAPIVGVPLITEPGFNIFAYPAFRKRFKCVFKNEINLGAGASHKEEINVKVNKSLAEADLYQMSTSNITGIPGVTMMWFACMRGSVCQVTDNGSAPQTVQNTSATLAKWAVAYSVIRKIHFGFKEDTAALEVNIDAPTMRIVSGTSSGQIQNNVDAPVTVEYTS